MKKAGSIVLLFLFLFFSSDSFQELVMGYWLTGSANPWLLDYGPAMACLFGAGLLLLWRQAGPFPRWGRRLLAVLGALVWAYLLFYILRYWFFCPPFSGALPAFLLWLARLPDYAVYALTFAGGLLLGACAAPETE